MGTSAVQGRQERQLCYEKGSAKGSWAGGLLKREKKLSTKIVCKDMILNLYLAFEMRVKTN